ncbi:hypothetical protein [Nonomuraea jabiensis]|uniref:hypothetical protein n=1 Tax=Nonomuraea jabiensis TaxID=882448 RepID=UPI003D7375A0
MQSSGVFVKQRSLTLDQLADSRLSHRRLELIEDGDDLSPRQAQLLASKLGCDPLLFHTGLTEEQTAQIQQDLAQANEALTQGRSGEARARFASVVAYPALGSRPDLWRQAETGLALVFETEGDLRAAIDRLSHLLAVLAPLGEPLPAMAFEDQQEAEERIDVALACAAACAKPAN